MTDRPPAPPLALLFRPRRVAVIGATDRDDSLGGYALRNILASPGLEQVHPINPSRSEIRGVPCLANLRDAPPVDVAYILLPAHACAQALADCAACGVPFAVVASSGFGEGGAGTESGDLGLTDEVRAVTRVVGPNTNGLWNAVDGIRLGFNTSHGMDLRPGRLALVSQTGAVLGSVIAALDELGVGIAYAIATGNESDLTLPDYIAEFVRDDAVGAIGLLVDGITDPVALLDVLGGAGATRKPIILLKMGTSEAGRQATELHASRVADPVQALVALCRRLGIAVTTELETFVSALAILGSERRLGGRPEVLALSTSGAGAAMLADGAADAGLQMAALPPDSRRRLRELLRLTTPHNPLDITGQSRAGDWVRDLFTAFVASNPDCPVVYLVTLLKHATDARSREFAAIARSAADRLFLTYLPAALPGEGERDLREAGVLIYRSQHAMFGGLALARRAAEAATAPWPGGWAAGYRAAAVAEPVPDARVRLHDDMRGALAAAGVRFPGEAVGNTVSEVVAAARGMSFPVALKVLAASALHKAASGGVVLDVRTAEEVRDEARRLLDLGGPGARVLVQPMVAAGPDLFAGYERQDRYGPMLLVGAGGGAVEEHRDVRALLLPAGREEIREALAGLRIGAALTAASPSGPVWDVAAAVETLLAFAAYVGDPANRVVAAEINPIRVLPRGDGAVALDVRVVSADAVDEKRSA